MAAGKLDGIGVLPAQVKSRARSQSLQRRIDGAGVALDSARLALAGFRRGAHIFGLTKGQFSMIDIAAAALEITGPARVTVWTWCIAEYEIEAFSAFFHDKKIQDLRVIMDWSAGQRDMPLTVDLQAQFGVDCIRVTKTHAKIITIENDTGWRVVARGSMNLNKNPRFEQFDISDDPAIYEVIAEVERELWAKGKPLPVSKLRHNDCKALYERAGGQTAAVEWGP